MKHPTRLALAALTAALLSACAEPIAAPPSAGGPLDQQDVTESASSLSEQLLGVLGRAAKDEGVVALQGFPQNSVMTNPFFGYGVSAMKNHHPERRNPMLGALATNDLPTGDYNYEVSDEGAEAWVRVGDSDDLSLTWPYDAAPETPAPDAATATATFDWDALSPTVRADAYGESIEVPTGLNLALTANGQGAADVDVATTYYTGCGEATLEPTSLTVNGTGSLLKLENVGYRVSESGAGDSVTTQGKVTVVDEGIALEWNVAVNGELTRQNCLTESFVPEGGAISLSLGGFQGDTKSVALNVEFSGTDEPDVSGAITVNDDKDREVTFSGTLSDANGNGVPGEDVTVRFPNGSSTTLEKLLESLGTVAALGNLRHH